MQNNPSLKKSVGSCLCQNVSFEIIGDFKGFYLCHCSRCRKVTGSAHAANLFSKTASLMWISGNENVKTFHLPNSRFVKTFCGVCGSALPTEKDGRLLVPAGCLASDVSLTPDAHVFMGSKANWDKDLEQVPQFETLPNKT